MQQKLDQISLSQLFFLDYINNWRFIFSHIRPNLTREGCLAGYLGQCPKFDLFFLLILLCALVEVNQAKFP